MLQRSLGASSFAGFWRHWNPIWSYGLSRYIFRPLGRLLPLPLALVATFLVSGLIHDAVIMVMRGGPALLFTPWFLLMALILLLGEAAGWNFGGLRWPVRAAIMLGYLGSTFALALSVDRAMAAWLQQGS
ncbi:MAG: acyltransferase [Sphingomonas sp.]|nr:MAG: acyltransferase [Sphingomonas sp.]